MAALSARHCRCPPTTFDHHRHVSMASPRDGRDRGKEGTAAPEQEHGEGEDDHSNVDEDEAQDCFFESFDRVPSRVSFCVRLPSSSSSDDDDEDDVRVSFASAVGPPQDFRSLTFGRESDLGDIPEHYDADLDGKDNVGGRPSSAGTSGFDYGVWMAQPMSIKERRRRLLQGMGLASRKDLATALRTISTLQGVPPLPDAAPSPAPAVAPEAGPTSAAPPEASARPSSPQSALVRRRSDGHLGNHRRCPAVSRTSSAPPSLSDERNPRRGVGAGDARGEDDGQLTEDKCRIKNLDTGKEFVVSEFGKDGNWGRVNDTQTGVQLSTEEFERFFGYSPIIKELMRRTNLGGGSAVPPVNPKLSQSVRMKNLMSGSRKKGSGWLKNIKSVANSVTWLIAEKGDAGTKANGKSSGDGSSELMKVRQHGKSHKELTGLYMCQEIHAHQGSIWTIKFSSDGRFLASAGEDRVVQVWQVQESETSSSSLRGQDVRSPSSSSQLVASPDLSPVLGTQQSKKTKKGKSSKRSLPDYIVMPESIFSLSEKPFCSFEGHLDDVLDLSWSRSQLLLSSSMDKTVRLWDLETKTCLKLFAHNDYVTCIQFNPMDDRYFISGSLDAKVRIWNVPARQVVDWTDLHEMVTATCFTPDGQGAIVGSHKGSCRIYKISDSDYKLSQECQIDIRHRKKKTHAKKITGFEFAPGNPSEVLVTSADSRIRIFDGVDMIHKIRGFKNTSSQISASYTPDGKHVICASEDSHVYVWKREQTRNAGSASKSKGWSTTRAYEHFYCKDVSAAIPWPNSGSNCSPISLPQLSGRFNQLDCLGESQRSTSTLDDIFPSSRSDCPALPPLSKKSSGRVLFCADDPGNISRSGSQRGSESFASASELQRLTDPASLSSSFPSWGGSNRGKANNADGANAWGLVVVTAGLGGDIRVYQNFGMPLRLSRQANLFL